jgi:transposase
MAHVTGQSRYQSTLFPEVLDEVVSIDDPVRVIDAFVETLDLAALGFSKVAAEEMGRPPYAPGDLLKLYVYGYLHRVRSSRRLEAETQRNVQVMWLINRLTPAFKPLRISARATPERSLGYAALLSASAGNNRCSAPSCWRLTGPRSRRWRAASG